MGKSKFKSIRWRWVILVILLAMIALGVKAYHDTMGDPVIKRTRVVLRDLPAGTLPLTIALISDIHVAGPEMPPERLARIVERVNALKPDLIAIAGDLVSDKSTATHIYEPEEIVAPLAALNAPLGVVAVPGNHDHWFDMPGLAEQLDGAGIVLLSNEARAFGPLAIGGLDDAFTNRDDIATTLANLDRTRGAKMILSHSPDVFPQLPDNIGLTLAGHTHCGQIAYPWGGAPAHLSDYGDQYGCGRVDENGKVLVVGSGLGTSLIPMRLFTQPTIWLVEIRPSEPVAK